MSNGDKFTYEVYSGHVDPGFIFYPSKSVAQPECVSYVIESGKESDRGYTGTTYDDSGFKYYRLYSDGWLEQGGRTVISPETGNSDRTITMMKSFKDDKSYSLTLGNILTGQYVLHASNLTENSFSAHYSTDTTAGSIEYFCWKAEGYVN